MALSAADEVLASLSEASVPEPVKLAVLELIRDDLAGDAPPLDSEDPIYLTAVDVEGFRGVGPAATLALEPGPGLTLVVGPNGCGKSSFAEALERAFTGTTLRWKGASADAQEDWRNVHHDGPSRVKVRMRRRTETVDTNLAIAWKTEEGFEAGKRVVSQPGSAAVPDWATSNWGPMLDLYPPLLPYKEIGAVVDGKPSELFDQFDPLLGLGALDGATTEATRRSKAAGDRITEEGRLRKEAQKALAAMEHVAGVEDLLSEMLALKPDPELASALAAALAGEVVARSDVSAFERTQTIDLDAVRLSLDEVDRRRNGLRELEHADVSRNALVVDLLERALGVHSPGESRECPVCEKGSLDDHWREQAAARVEQLKHASAAITDSRAALRQNIQHVRGYLSGLSSLRESELIADSGALVAVVGDLGATLDADEWPSDLHGRFTEVSRLLESCRAAAAEVRNDTASRARPVVEAVMVWAEAARAAEGAAEEKQNFKKAADWLKDEIQRLRVDRLAAIDAQAHGIWEKLRQTCTVELGPLVLEGTKTRRRLALTCTTEGREAMARSILSQGELHAIALSLYLPRATHEASPFGFIAIDDPVQALDRAKVDGLAEVLADLAVRRQVIVFTHDDRLPDAVLRLGFSANIVRVARSDGSRVEVEYGSDQAERALKDADTLARDESIELKYALRAVAGACRAAVEAKALQAFRQSKAAQGMSVDEIDSLLGKAGHSFWPRVSLGVFGEVRSDARKDIEAKYSAALGRVLGSLNRGGHELLSSWEPRALVQETRRAITTMFGA